MQTLGSPASVVASIREEAEAEVERIQETAAAELATIRAEAASASVAVADRETRLAAARRETEERIAKQEWEGRRAVMQQREEWMQRVMAAARERWTCTDALIADARAHLPVGPFTVDGCVVKVGDLSFDNGYEARSRRFEPEWRGALSGMYTP